MKLTYKILDKITTIKNPKGHQYAYAIKFLFPVSNKEAEYEALLVALWMAKSLKLTHILVRSDSQVVIGHMTGVFEVKEDNMQKYLLCVKHTCFYFSNVQFEKVPSEQDIKQICYPRSMQVTTLKEHGLNLYPEKVLTRMFV
ncbi:hypothetical protein M9H77_06901 [Catharanthus roseus]|uniref:Uncharacterized protein n=1 Tax=Catharanthus roseus TaxID=4058 RepID=A0ACC0BTI3_CATRO|nr:hypothetical protein M9H77_06901 [Catharanthus roseus]